MSDDFKCCPFCKEQIRTSAIKCRFCGEWFEQTPEGEVPNQDKLHLECPESAPPSVDSDSQPSNPSASVAQNAAGPQPRLSFAKRTAIGICLLCLAVGLIVFCARGTEFSQNATNLLSKFIVRTLAVAAIAFWFVRQSSKWRDYAFLTFSIICLGSAVILGYNIRSAVAGHQPISKGSPPTVLSNVLTMIDSVAQNATNGTFQVVKTGDPAFDVAFEPLNWFFKEYLATLNRMEDDIAKLQSVDVFSMSVLSLRSNILAEVQKREQAKEIISNCKESIPPMVASARKRLASQPASAAHRGVVEGFDNTLKAQLPGVDEMFALRLRRENADLSFLRFMAKAFDDCIFTKDTISFKTTSNFAAYRDFSKAIEDAIADAEAFQKRQSGIIQAEKDKIQKALR